MTIQQIDTHIDLTDVLLEHLCGRAGAAVKSVPESETRDVRSSPLNGHAFSGKLPVRSQDPLPDQFIPPMPDSLAQAKLSDPFVVALLLKILLYRGRSAGADVAQHIALPFGLVEKLLQRLKNDHLVEHKGQVALNDYQYELTDLGVQRARHHVEQCPYGGAAPVAIEDYVVAVAAQSPQNVRPNIETLRRAFEGLILSSEMLFRVGRAVHSGRGLFLHGAPGNGKTSIAERITRAFGANVWIPRAIIASGQIVRVFDPICHEELPRGQGEWLSREDKFDRRWVRIRRPTIVVGGELRMESLDITSNKDAGASEAPLQLKSNCGTLVIDDFGRQQISPTELLNRWVVPLEKRHDFLNLPNGCKLQVPFEQFVIFSTNLEPKSLVDEAFLRRIPYKINVPNPTKTQFRDLFRETAVSFGIAATEDMLDYLITRHYEAPGREFRFCHPRELLHHVAVYCDFLGIPRKLSVEAFDAAAGDYFASH